MHKSEYYKVGIYNDDEKKRLFRNVHRLVAGAFVPNEDSKQFVDHINEDKLDNRSLNLRWVTRQENTQFYVENRKKDENFQFMKSNRKCIKISFCFTPQVVQEFESFSATGVGSAGVSNCCRYWNGEINNEKKRGKVTWKYYVWCWEEDKEKILPLVKKKFRDRAESRFGKLTSKQLKSMSTRFIREMIIPNAKPIWKLDSNGKKIKLYNKKSEIFTELNIEPSRCTAAFRWAIVKQKLYHGHRWKYATLRSIRRFYNNE